MEEIRCQKCNSIMDTTIKEGLNHICPGDPFKYFWDYAGLTNFLTKEPVIETKEKYEWKLK